MSTFSRAQADHLSPPEGYDPHPWSEELCGILEDAGLPQVHVDAAIKLFDDAMQADPVKFVGYADLLSMASLCEEFDSEHAHFWLNKTGETVTVSGDSYEDTLTKAINVFRDQDGTGHANKVGDYLWDVAGLRSEAYNKAWEVLDRLRNQYVFRESDTPQPAEGDGAVADALMVVNDAANDARHAGDYAKANALVRARVTLYRASTRPAATAQVPEEVEELRLGLGQIAARVSDDPVMVRCCSMIDGLLAAAPAAPKGRGVDEAAGYGSAQFASYLQECDQLAIQPDVAGAFNAGWTRRAALANPEQQS